MRDDRETILVRRPGAGPDGGGAPAVEITYPLADGREHTVSLSREFVVGRAANCEICIDSEMVSRRHLQGRHDGVVWRIHDLGSTNGTFVDGKLVSEVVLDRPSDLQLGRDGPTVRMTPEGGARAERPSSKEPTALAHPSGSPFSGRRPAEYSLLVRQAVQRISKAHSRRYKGIIAALSLLLVAAVGVGVFQHWRLERMEALAVDIFYGMKSVELQLAQLSRDLDAAGKRDDPQVRSKRRQLGMMAAQYDSFLDQLHVFDRNLSAEDEIILRMARVFGECELRVPSGFADEVKTYIQAWRSTPRYESALSRARDKDYIPRIVDALVSNHLPPQFLYLALQESNMRHNAVGPRTRYGIAKGMWQFIPETGLRYGLRTGPLVEVARYDPRDQRHDFERSTHAAARYLRDIYTTDAQASGLLVMASYNWGENNIIRLLRSLPEDPRDRNFWSLQQKHRIPSETYNYVLSIFSAAVIGEDPRLFGFDFDNPLAGVDLQRLGEG